MMRIALPLGGDRLPDPAGARDLRSDRLSAVRQEPDLQLAAAARAGRRMTSRPSAGLVWLAIGFGVIGVVAAVAWTRVNINRFSIHALYRNRLIRGYLGASNPKRAPNPFTGFDEADNIAMAGPVAAAAGRMAAVPRRQHRAQRRQFETAGLAGAQGRAFTATPLHCGTATVSAIGGPREYGDNERGGIYARHGAGDLGRGREPEHGLSLLADRDRCCWRCSTCGSAGGSAIRARTASPTITSPMDRKIAIQPFIARDVRADDGRPAVRLSVRRRPFRESRPLRNDPAPLPLHRDQRRRLRSGLRLRGSRQRGAQDRDRSRRLHQLRQAARAQEALEGRHRDRGRLLRDRRDRLQDRAGMEFRHRRKPGGGAGRPRTATSSTSSRAITAPKAPASWPTRPRTRRSRTRRRRDQFFSESQFESYRTLGFEIMDGVLGAARKPVPDLKDVGSRPIWSAQLHGNPGTAIACSRDGYGCARLTHPRSPRARSPG